MTVFGYVRVSTIQQASEGDSLEAQIKQVTSYALSRGLASRISEVKQMRKSQGYYVGGRRGFGFNIKDGKKVPNKKEQKLIAEMKRKKAGGESMLAIHRWLNNDMEVKLNYSSMRVLLVS